jgi:hypothetical protein
MKEDITKLIEELILIAYEDRLVAELEKHYPQKEKDFNYYDET